MVVCPVDTSDLNIWVYSLEIFTDPKNISESNETFTASRAVFTDHFGKKLLFDFIFAEKYAETLFSVFVFIIFSKMHFHDTKVEIAL